MMSRSIFLLILFFKFSCFAMLGGVEVKPNDPLLSSFVGIIVLDNHKKQPAACTGTIISRKTILTAAHCFNHVKGEKNISITISTTHKPYSSVVSNPSIKHFTTTKFSVYPKYLISTNIHKKLSYDIALIHLENSAFTNQQRPLPLVFPKAMNSFPSAVQVYSVGDPGKENATTEETIFKKDNFNLFISDQVRGADPENLYTGVYGGFFLVDHPKSKLLSGDSGSSALANRYGVPTIIGVHTGRYRMSEKVIGYSFVNLNEPEINKWIRTQLN